MAATGGYLDNTTADLRLLGVPNIFSSFAHNDSASRVNMYNHHLTQAMVLNKPEFNKLFTGVENKLIDYTFNHSRREYPCEVVAIIPKYDIVHVDNRPIFYIIVISHEPKGPKLDYFTIDRYWMGSNGFGWIPEIENINQIKIGAILDPSLTITHSPAVRGNQYCPGTNLNVIFSSFPETIEDAFIISESAAKRLETTKVSQLVLDIRQDRRPLNYYGDDKVFPDIGQTVREDGAFCGFRPGHWTTVVADSDPTTLKQTLTMQDDIIYIDPNAKIVDLTFNVNRDAKLDCYDQVRKYMVNNTKCWEGIYAKYLQYRGKLKLTDRMSTLVTTAIYRMISYGSRNHGLEREFGKIMRNCDVEGANRQVVDFLQMVVTYTVPRRPNKGDKLTDLHGAR